MPDQSAKTSKTPPQPERAAGTIDQPIGPGEAQPGDRSERGAQLGGPVDVFPTRQDRSGLEPPISTDEEPPAGAAELDRQ